MGTGVETCKNTAKIQKATGMGTRVWEQGMGTGYGNRVWERGPAKRNLKCHAAIWPAGVAED